MRLENSGTDIQFEQRDYSGESHIIVLHPAQVAYIAASLYSNEPERAKAQPNCETERIAILEKRIATLERRMLWMRDRFGECYEELPKDMQKRCSEANEFYAWLNASFDIADEFCADFTNAPNSPTADTQKTSSSPVDDKCPPRAAKRAGAHPERADDVRTGELFTGT